MSYQDIVSRESAEFLDICHLIRQFWRADQTKEPEEAQFHRTNMNLRHYVLCIIVHKRRLMRISWDRVWEMRGMERITLSAAEDRVLNCCQIIEKIRKFGMKELRDGDDIFLMEGNHRQNLRRDLLDKKVPFDFLLQLFELTKNKEDPRDDLVDLVNYFFREMTRLINPKPPLLNKTQILDTNPACLLGLLYNSLCFRPVADQMPSRVKFENMEEEEEFELINNATDLLEAGIKFKKSEGSVCLLHVEFERGVMKMPPLKVSHRTLEFLNLLMQHESNFPSSHSHQRYVSDYGKFLRCLVNSPEDVELLRRCGIIENWLGGDQMICNRLNGFRRTTTISRRFTYSKIFRDVNQHCRQRRNASMAKPWSNNFNSPRSLMLLIVAVVLLVLMIVQTVFSVLSYYHLKQQVYPLLMKYPSVVL